MKLLKKGGTLLQYAIVHSGEKVEMDPVLMFNNELTYTASFCQSHNFGRAVDVLASGIVDGDSLVTGEFPLDQVPIRYYPLSRYTEAFDTALNDKAVMRVMFTPQEE